MRLEIASNPWILHLKGMDAQGFVEPLNSYAKLWSWEAPTAKTKCHRLGAFINICLFFMVLEGGKSKVKFPADLQMAAFSLDLHVVERGSSGSLSLLVGALTPS